MGVDDEVKEELNTGNTYWTFDYSTEDDSVSIYPIEG